MTVDYERDQLVIFSEPRARHNDLPTAKAAAAKVKPESLEACIVETLRMYERVWGEGATDEQIVKHLKYDVPGSVVTARSRLYKRGLVVADGTRENSRGNDMTIWRLSQ